MFRTLRLVLVVAVSAAAGAAQAAVEGRSPLTGAGVIAHATPVVTAIMLLLAAASLAAVSLWGLQAAQGERAGAARKARRLAMLSAISTSAPLFGLAAAAYTLLNCSIGLANVSPTPSLAVLAPGFAEALMSVMLGLFAAALAAAGRRMLDVPAGAAKDRDQEVRQAQRA